MVKYRCRAHAPVVSGTLIASSVAKNKRLALGLPTVGSALYVPARLHTPTSRSLSMAFEFCEYTNKPARESLLHP